VGARRAGFGAREPALIMQPARRRPGFAGLVSLLAVWILESTGPTQAVAQDAVIRVLSPVEGDILSASARPVPRDKARALQAGCLWHMKR